MEKNKIKETKYLLPHKKEIIPTKKHSFKNFFIKKTKKRESRFIKINITRAKFKSKQRLICRPKYLYIILFLVILTFLFFLLYKYFFYKNEAEIEDEKILFNKKTEKMNNSTISKIIWI